jgi:cell division transport system permease protein
MIRPRRFFRQIGRHVMREKRLSFGSFLVLAIVLILIDIFWIASINITRQYDEILRKAKMELFLSGALPDSLVPVLKSSLLLVEEVDSISFVSKEMAARILENDLGPGILDELEDNPLPRSFTLHFNRSLSLNELDTLYGRLVKMEGVEAIEFGRPWIEKMENFGSTLRIVGYAAGALILFVVLLTMANTNRLTARSKSQDFFQLKLLGAGPSYLVYPFLAEGFLSAFIAAALGWAFVIYIADKVTFAAFVLTLPGLDKILIYSLLAGLTGMAGAYLGIRRFLIS